MQGNRSDTMGRPSNENCITEFTAALSIRVAYSTHLWLVGGWAHLLDFAVNLRRNEIVGRY